MIGFDRTPGQRGDIRVADTLLATLPKAAQVLGDSTYDGDLLRAFLAERGTAAVIKPNPTRSNVPLFDKMAYKLRNLIERAFSHLKDWRRVATRMTNSPETLPRTSHSPLLSFGGRELSPDPSDQQREGGGRAEARDTLDDLATTLECGVLVAQPLHLAVDRGNLPFNLLQALLVLPLEQCLRQSLAAVQRRGPVLDQGFACRPQLVQSGNGWIGSWWGSGLECRAKPGESCVRPRGRSWHVYRWLRRSVAPEAG